MGKYKLTAEQKEEVRRLTQLANRRIRTAEKQYRLAGKEVAPRNVVGHLQTKEDWHTKGTPLSRSVVFDSKKEYLEQLRFLRSFDPKSPGQTKPNMKEYSVLQRSKTAKGLITSLGSKNVTLELLQQINQLNAAQLSDFWKIYSDKSSKLGVKYSSLAAMQDTMNELNAEDQAAFIKKLNDTAKAIEDKVAG